MLRSAVMLIVAGLVAGCVSPAQKVPPLRYDVTAAALPGKDGELESWIIRTDRVTGQTWRYETRKTKTGPNSSTIKTDWYPMGDPPPALPAE